MERTIIAVFCYKRAAKLKKSMEALLKNPECPDMDIVFFCDGYKGAHDKEGVLKTREYIDSIDGFRNIYKHYRETNLSTGPNFQKGITWLCDHYDQFIVIEDDLIVSPNYIRYMLDGLEYYRDQKAVFTISGYCFPLNKGAYGFDTVIHSRFCCYGWSSWSDRVKNVIWDKDLLYRLMNSSSSFKKRLNAEGLDLFRTLIKQLHGRISTWDIQMQVYVSEHNLKVVYPVISKATNIGFDNESTNTFGIDYLKTVVDTGEKRSFKFCNVGITEPRLQKQLKKPYSLPALASRKIMNTLIKLTGRVKHAVS
jgi:hypothetical protein